MLAGNLFYVGEHFFKKKITHDIFRKNLEPISYIADKFVNARQSIVILKDS